MTSDEESWESWELPDPDSEPARAQPPRAAGTPTDPMIGRVLGGRYRIESLLGKGAMGTVYKARHIKVGRVFAIKVLHSRLLLDPKTSRRFEREANLAGTLHHPNVVGVIDVGETDSVHYMVMEFAEGRTLGSMIAGPMASRRVLAIAQQLCDGLQHAHEKGLIHRDFKPDNVIVEVDKLGAERPRIVDFGIAILREDAADSTKERLTTAGLVLGTPHYMAPEHAMGGTIDHRIDLFALGVILYEMLTGKMPFDGDGVEVARANLMSATPAMGVRVPGLVVDPLLEAFTRLLMHKEPSERPDSAKAARHLLDLIENDPTMAARILGITPPAAPAAPGAVRRLPHASMSVAELSGPHRALTPPQPLPVEVVAQTEELHAADIAALATPLTAAQEPLLTPPAMRPYVTSQPAALQLGVVPDGSGQVPAIPARRAPLYAAVGGAAIAAIVAIAIGVYATRASPPSPTTAAATPPPTAATPTSTTAPAPTTPATTATPAPTITTTSPAIETAIPNAPAGNAIAAPASPRPTKTVAPSRRATTGKAAPSRPGVTTTTTAIAKPTATPGAATASDANAVATLYAAVGRELKALDAIKGTDAISSLWMRYRMIRIQEALTSEDKRLAAIKTLGQLRREVAAAR